MRWRVEKGDVLGCTLPLKDDVKPVFSWAYAVTRVHEEMLKKETERIVSLGVLEESNDSECGALSFS